MSEHAPGLDARCAVVGILEVFKGNIQGDVKLHPMLQITEVGESFPSVYQGVHLRLRVGYEEHWLKPEKVRLVGTPSTWLCQVEKRPNDCRAQFPFGQVANN